MEKYKFLEHVSDVLFESYGSTFEEALENAAEAMFATIAPVEKLREEQSFVVEERASNLEELANFTLSDLLSQGDIRELFLKRFKVEEFSKANGGYVLEGTAYGERMSPGKGGTSVKAVTLHETKAEKTKQGWRIRILLDI